ncbi:hypothetical protein TNCV_3604101 [Trichonephila clavipes]|nr:hypothetical protein TNCV_3604101 [Trichonephila clavipes]
MFHQNGVHYVLKKELYPPSHYVRVILRVRIEMQITTHSPPTSTDAYHLSVNSAKSGLVVSKVEAGDSEPTITSSQFVVKEGIRKKISFLLRRVINFLRPITLELHPIVHLQIMHANDFAILPYVTSITHVTGVIGIIIYSK